MSLGCITAGGTEPPDKIIDTSTLSLSLDNQGVATLQISILTKNSNIITNSCFTFDLGSALFKGYIDSDTPRKLEGTKYFEHNIIARGMVC